MEKDLLTALHVPDNIQKSKEPLQKSLSDSIISNDYAKAKARFDEGDGHSVASKSIKPIQQTSLAKTLAGYDDEPKTEECYLPAGTVAKRYCVGISTIWRWAKEDGPFPAPVALRKGTTRWRLSDLLSYEKHVGGER